VQLPDDRILLHKHRSNAQWCVTVERYIKSTESSLDCVNDILWNLFGIDPFGYSDAFAEIKRYPPTKGIQDKNIVIYIMKLKSAIAFRTKPEEQFMAMPWNTLLNDIRINSVYAGNGLQKHTPNAIIVSRELHIKEVF